jgi:phytoene synthase
MTATVAPPALLDAYGACEALTRAAAGNFYYGIRLLPPDKRRAMCAVYAFARQVDDIGDGVQPAQRKRELLARARAELERADTSPVRAALADAERRFGLPRDALEDLIDGVEMDVSGRRYATFEELLDYCRHVAGTIGRLCVAIFGSSDRERADRLAEELGVAMQLTNILRDVREDSERGRLYLPAEDLERFGCPAPLAAPAAQFAALIRFEAARAGESFARGLQLLELLDARSAACVSAMSGIYRRILERIERDPLAVRDGGVALTSWQKAWVALCSLAGGTAMSVARARP